MDLERREFWEEQVKRLERLKKYSVGTSRHTEALVLSFYAKLKTMSRDTPHDVLNSLSEMYKAHFEIEEQNFGYITRDMKLRVDEEMKCRGCGLHMELCTCSSDDVKDFVLK